MALINRTYHKLISCIPFRYLYRRDPQASTLVAPTLRAIVEPLPNTKISKAKDKDLDGNKEVLSPLLEENSNRQEAAEQERNKEDNRSITLSALTTSNKDRDNISNIEDNSNQLLTLGKSSNKEDKEEDYNLPNRL